MPTEKRAIRTDQAPTPTGPFNQAIRVGNLVFTAGQYTQVSMFLNTFGVQLDEGQTLDPDLKGF